MVHFAIIGAGDAGSARLRAIPPGALVAVQDLNRSRAEELVRQAGTGRVMDSVLDAVHNPKVDAVIVATVNAGLGEAALAAIKAGKHVLIEAPGARTPRGIEQLRQAAQREGVTVRVGYTARSHQAVRRAHRMVEEGEIGLPLYVRGRFGHGGWPGFKSDWRANPKLAGGGVLLDQGAALIDLARFFLGDFTQVRGTAECLYWDIPLEDNAFLELKTAKGQSAWLHAGATEWKPTFAFEIIGREGKIEIHGLGGMYGSERLVVHRSTEGAHPAEGVMYEFAEGDGARKQEMASFIEDIETGREPQPGLDDAQAVLRIVHEVYRQNESDSAALDVDPDKPNRIEEVRGRDDDTGDTRGFFGRN